MSFDDVLAKEEASDEINSLEREIIKARKQGALDFGNKLKAYFEKQNKEYDEWITTHPNDYDTCAEEHYFKEVEKKVTEWIKELEK